MPLRFPSLIGNLLLNLIEWLHQGQVQAGVAQVFPALPPKFRYRTVWIELPKGRNVGSFHICSVWFRMIVYGKRTSFKAFNLLEYPIRQRSDSHK